MKILPALPGAPFVAGLVLGAYQAVGPAATIGRQVEVGPGAVDAVLDVAAIGFGSLQDPGLPLGIGQKTAELSAVRATTAERGCPDPVDRRRQRLGGPDAKVRHARGAQSFN